MVLLIALLGIGYGVVRAVRENGRIDYCRTEMTADGQMEIVGHRAFREDVVLIKPVGSADILKWAEIFHCEFH